MEEYKHLGEVIMEIYEEMLDLILEIDMGFEENEFKENEE